MAPITSTTSGFFYVPPSVSPPMLPVPGTTCTVANDGRLYSEDHIWVKTLPDNMAVLGLTATMVEIISEPSNITLPAGGSLLASGDDFGTVSGFKMTADIITPVSGTVVQINNLILSQAGRGPVMVVLNDDPFNGGWLIAVQLSQPDELKSLMSAQAYLKLVSTGK